MHILNIHSTTKQFHQANSAPPPVIHKGPKVSPITKVTQAQAEAEIGSHRVVAITCSVDPNDEGERC